MDALLARLGALALPDRTGWGRMWRCCWMRPGRHAAPKPLARLTQRTISALTTLIHAAEQKAQGKRHSASRPGPYCGALCSIHRMANKSTEK
jgi:hypothetical protein